MTCLEYETGLTPARTWKRKLANLSNNKDDERKKREVGGEVCGVLVEVVVGGEEL